MNSPALFVQKLTATAAVPFRIHAIKNGAEGHFFTTSYSESAYVLFALMVKDGWSLAVYLGQTNVTSKFTDRYFKESGERHG